MVWHNNISYSPSEALSFISANSKPTAYFYSLGGLLESAENDQLDFIKILKEIFNDIGYLSVLINGTQLDAPLQAKPNDIHIWMIERPLSTSFNGQIMYCFPSYLYGFWYFDPKGIRNNSSIHDLTYRKVTTGNSLDFFARLTEEFVISNKTKFEQEPTNPDDIPDCCITIATQTFATPTMYPTYLDYPTLIESVLDARGGFPVVIKPHPLTKFKDALELAKYHDPQANIFVEPFSLHPLLEKSIAVVTRCSAVAIEAMLHQVPAIVAGKVDFHHMVYTVTEAQDIKDALVHAQTNEFSYPEYIEWFFNEQLYATQSPQLVANRIKKVLMELGLQSN